MLTLREIVTFHIIFNEICTWRPSTCDLQETLQQADLNRITTAAFIGYTGNLALVNWQVYHMQYGCCV